MSVMTDRQVEYVRECLAVFLVSGQVTELRALHVEGRQAVSLVGADLDLLARRAVELDHAGAKGVYFIPNPLRPDLAGGRASARKADVSRRHWLLIDVDPVRPADTSSTEEERQAAWSVLDRCRGTLEGAGFVGAVVGNSGNGWHLCYPIDLPNDDAAQELVKAVLKGLQARCGSDVAQVDCSCHDAPRIWKLYGTTPRKGTPTEERPQRSAWLVESRPWDAETAGRNSSLLSRLLELWKLIDDKRKGRPGGDVVERARTALLKWAPAISGQQADPASGNENHGHAQTFAVACFLVKEFGLTVEQGLVAIQDWNQRCRPPWSEYELRHKLADAAKKVESAPVSLNGSNGHHISVPNGEVQIQKPPDGFPAPIPASQLKAAEKSLWLWHGFINRGGITLLSALWKSGKTTLLASMLKALEGGGTFCGHEIAAGKALYVTEESETRWADRRDRLGLKDHIEFLVRPFTGKPKWDDWQAFLNYTVQLTIRAQYDLVVFDPLVNLWPVKDENDASQVTTALMPLHQVADKTSILLAHHTRKGDGQEATASRGSGALTAFVDTIIELRRYTPDDQADRRRVLTGYGRDDDTLEEIVVTLGEQGEYSVDGTKKENKVLDIADVLRNLLPAEPPGITFAEWMDKWPAGKAKPNRNRCYEVISKGADSGLWNRQGAGVRGNPHTYWKLAEGEIPTHSADPENRRKSENELWPEST